MLAVGTAKDVLYLSEICITATAFVKPGDNYLGIQLRLVAESSSILLYCCAASKNSILLLCW